MKNNKYKQMNFNENDIEYYLLTKEYASLSSKEMEFVKEAIPTEEEYNSMRQLLLAMEEVPLEDELIPNPEIKNSLVTAFEKARWEKGVGTKETAKVVSIHQENDNRKKGVFWFSIAASIVLLIGLFLNREYLFLPENNQLAMLDEPKNVEEKNKELSSNKENIAEVDMDNETESTIEYEENELLDNNEVAAIIEEDSESSSLKREETSLEYKTITSQPSAGNQLALNEAIEKEISSEGSFDDSEVIALADEVAEEAGFANLSDKDLSNVQVTSSIGKIEIDVVESKSLQGDKEMIDLFYTAL